MHHVDISGLAEPPEEVDGDGAAQREVQALEYPPLHGAQLTGRVRVICDVHEILDFRRVDFFVLHKGQVVRSRFTRYRYVGPKEIGGTGIP